MPNRLSQDIDPAIVSLEKKLREFRILLWKVRIIEALLCGLGGFIISYLLLFISDRFWTTPPLLSLTFLLLGTGGMVIFAPYWIHRWIWNERLNTQLARLIAQKYPQFGDQLLGILELQTLKNNQFSSDQLIYAAYLQLARHSEQISFTKAIPHTYYKTLFVILLVLASIIVGIFIYIPDAGLNALKRWHSPLANIPRYTFTKFQHIPEKLFVPIGESFNVHFQLHPDSKFFSSSITAQCNEYQPIEEPIVVNSQGERYANFTFPGIFDQSSLKISAGDASYLIQIIPCERPAIKEITAKVSYPTYTKRPTEIKKLRMGTLPVLKGSRVKIYSTATEPLKSAYLISENNKEKTPLKIAQSTTEFPSKIISAPFIFSFNWENNYEIKGAKDFKIRLAAKDDQRPEVSLQAPERELYILRNEAVELQIQATDDYGIKELGVVWKGSHDEKFKQISQGTPTTTRMSSSVIFHPETLNISPQRIVIKSFAKDFNPNGVYSYSDPLNIVILDEYEHAKLVRTKIDNLSTKLESLISNEQIIKDQLEELSQQKDVLNKASISNLLNDLSRQQDQFQKLSQQWDDVMKMALKNEKINTQSLKTFCEAKNTLDNTNQESGLKIINSLKKATADSTEREERQSLLTQASQTEDQSLKKYQEAMDKLTETSKQVETGTFIARLEKAATDQHEVSERIDKLMPQVIGLIPEELSEQENLDLRNVITSQTSIINDVKWIIEDMFGFFARTQSKIHGDLAKKMRTYIFEHNTEQHIRELYANHLGIAHHFSLQAYEEMQQWPNLIKEMANHTKEESQDKKKSKTPQQRNDDEDKNTEKTDNDFDLMLNLMRVIQNQQEIRYKTRKLQESQAGDSKSNAQLIQQPT